MARRILVPLDGSTHAGYALPWAMSIAEKHTAAVHLVLVHEPDEYSEYAAAHFEDYDLHAKQQEEAYLEGVRQKLATDFGGRLYVHHLEGVVQETLAAEALRLGIDLVVMNVHGWGYTSRALLGSVSDYLMRHLQVPLLLLHSHVGAGPLHRPVAFQRVLIPLDGSELAGLIVPVAEELTAPWSAELRLVRVLSPPALSGDRSTADEHRAAAQATWDKSKDDARRYLESVAGPLGDRRRATTTQVLAGRKVAAAILQDAAAAECDLIAMSTHGRGGLARLLLGSVADKVVRTAEVPVLVYRPGQD